MLRRASSSAGATAPVSGEFLDPEEERQYLHASWPQSSRQYQLTLALGCILLGLSLVIDHLLGGNREAVLTVAVAKFITLAMATLSIALAGYRARIKQVDASLLAVAVTLAIANLSQLTTGMTTWPVLSLILLLQVLFFTLLVPARFIIKAAVCATLFIGFLAALLFIEAPAEAPETLIIQCSFCLLCLECARRVNRSQRRGHLSEEALETSRAALAMTEAGAGATGQDSDPAPEGDDLGSELRSLRRAGDEDQALIAGLLDAVDQGLCVFDRDLRVVRWNQRLIELLDYPGDLLRSGLGLEDLLRFNMTRGDFGAADSEAVIERRLAFCRTPGANRLGATEHLCFNGVHVEVGYHSAAEGLTIATFTDITEQMAAETREPSDPLRDGLTGLMNRLAFEQAIDGEIKRGRRGGRGFCLAKIDIDGFGAINQHHNHAFGDRLLQIVARALCREVREVDSLARFGKDEFFVLLSGLDQAKAATAVAERLIARVADPLVVDGQTIALTASIALAFHPRDGTDLRALEACLDLALGRGKCDGTAQVLSVARADAA